MATRESMQEYMTKVMDLADKDGLEADLVPAQLAGANVKGKGDKRVIVLTLQVVLDPATFKSGDIGFVFDRRTRIFGAGLLIPKELLAEQAPSKNQAEAGVGAQKGGDENEPT